MNNRPATSLALPTDSPSKKSHSSPFLRVSTKQSTNLNAGGNKDLPSSPQLRPSQSFATNLKKYPSRRGSSGANQPSNRLAAREHAKDAEASPRQQKAQLRNSILTTHSKKRSRMPKIITTDSRDQYGAQEPGRMSKFQTAHGPSLRHPNLIEQTIPQQIIEHELTPTIQKSSTKFLLDPRESLSMARQSRMIRDLDLAGLMDSGQAPALRRPDKEEPQPTSLSHEAVKDADQGNEFLALSHAKGDKIITLENSEQRSNGSFQGLRREASKVSFNVSKNLQVLQKKDTHLTFKQQNSIISHQKAAGSNRSWFNVRKAKAEETSSSNSSDRRRAQPALRVCAVHNDPAVCEQHEPPQFTTQPTAELGEKHTVEASSESQSDSIKKIQRKQFASGSQPPNAATVPNTHTQGKPTSKFDLATFNPQQKMSNCNHSLEFILLAFCRAFSFSRPQDAIAFIAGGFQSAYAQCLKDLGNFSQINAFLNLMEINLKTLIKILEQENDFRTDSDHDQQLSSQTQIMNLLAMSMLYSVDEGIVWQTCNLLLLIFKSMTGIQINQNLQVLMVRWAQNLDAQGNFRGLGPDKRSNTDFISCCLIARKRFPNLNKPVINSLFYELAMLGKSKRKWEQQLENTHLVDVFCSILPHYFNLETRESEYLDLILDVIECNDFALEKERIDKQFLLFVLVDRCLHRLTQTSENEALQMAHRSYLKAVVNVRQACMNLVQSIWSSHNHIFHLSLQKFLEHFGQVFKPEDPTATDQLQFRYLEYQQKTKVGKIVFLLLKRTLRHSNKHIRISSLKCLFQLLDLYSASKDDNDAENVVFKLLVFQLVESQQSQSSQFYDERELLAYNLVLYVSNPECQHIDFLAEMLFKQYSHSLDMASLSNAQDNFRLDLECQSHLMDINLNPFYGQPAFYRGTCYHQRFFTVYDMFLIERVASHPNLPQELGSQMQSLFQKFIFLDIAAHYQELTFLRSIVTKLGRRFKMPESSKRIVCQSAQSLIQLNRQLHQFQTMLQGSDTMQQAVSQSFLLSIIKIESQNAKYVHNSNLHNATLSLLFKRHVLCQLILDTVASSGSSKAPTSSLSHSVQADDSLKQFSVDYLAKLYLQNPDCLVLQYLKGKLTTINYQSNASMLEDERIPRTYTVKLRRKKELVKAGGRCRRMFTPSRIYENNLDVDRMRNQNASKSLFNEYFEDNIDESNDTTLRTEIFSAEGRTSEEGLDEEPEGPPVRMSLVQPAIPAINFPELSQPPDLRLNKQASMKSQSSSSYVRSTRRAKDNIPANAVSVQESNPVGNEKRAIYDTADEESSNGSQGAKKEAREMTDKSPELFNHSPIRQPEEAKSNFEDAKEEPANLSQLNAKYVHQNPIIERSVEQTQIQQMIPDNESSAAPHHRVVDKMLEQTSSMERTAAAARADAKVPFEPSKIENENLRSSNGTKPALKNEIPLDCIEETAAKNEEETERRPGGAAQIAQKKLFTEPIELKTEEAKNSSLTCRTQIQTNQVPQPLASARKEDSSLNERDSDSYEGKQKQRVGPHIPGLDSIPSESEAPVEEQIATPAKVSKQINQLWQRKGTQAEREQRISAYSQQLIDLVSQHDPPMPPPEAQQPVPPPEPQPSQPMLSQPIHNAAPMQAQIGHQPQSRLGHPNSQPGLQKFNSEQERLVAFEQFKSQLMQLNQAVLRIQAQLNQLNQRRMMHQQQMAQGFVSPAGDYGLPAGMQHGISQPSPPLPPGHSAAGTPVMLPSGRECSAQLEETTPVRKRPRRMLRDLNSKSCRDVLQLANKKSLEKSASPVAMSGRKSQISNNLQNDLLESIMKIEDVHLRKEEEDNISVKITERIEQQKRKSRVVAKPVDQSRGPSDNRSVSQYSAVSNNLNQRGLMGATPRGMVQPHQFPMQLSKDQLSQFTGQLSQPQMIPQQYMMQPPLPQLAQPHPMYFGQPMLLQQPQYASQFQQYQPPLPARSPEYRGMPGQQQFYSNQEMLAQLRHQPTGHFDAQSQSRPQNIAPPMMNFSMLQPHQMY